MRDRLFEERPGYASAPKIFAHINADLGGAAVSGPFDEGMEAEPTGDLPFALRNPERMRPGGMLLKPRQPLRNRNLIQLRC
jgi:hypothetical protein